MTRRAALILLLWQPGLDSSAGATEFAGQRTFGAAATRGAFLSRGAGARPAGLGSSFTAVADDASAMAWNPAGLGQLSSLSVVAQHDFASEDIALSSLAIAVPVGEMVAGCSVAMVSYGTLEYRDASGAWTGEGSMTDGAVTQGWSFRNPAWLGGLGWSGVAVEVIQEAMATALLGVSVGTLVPFESGVTFGVSVLHLGPRVDGATLPGAFRVGTAYHTGPVHGVMDLSYGLADHLTDWGAGVEWRPVPQVSARAGWRQEGRGQGIGGARGITGGFGARLGRFRLDYAYVPFGDLVTTHRLSVEYRMPGVLRPAKLAPPPAPVTTTPVGKPPVRRREPTTKVMPALPGADADGVSLKQPAVVPVRPAGTSATTATDPSPRMEPAGDAGASTPFEDGPKMDPLLPPPAELESPGGDVEGLRGGGRSGAGRPGTGAAGVDPDAPLRGGR